LRFGSWFRLAKGGECGSFADIPGESDTHALRRKDLETMKLSRRAFMGGAVAATAGPAFAQVPSSGYVDVAVVGAGAAGIAAARKIAAAGRRVALVEAADRVGGRCFTESRTFGLAYDRGAHWIYAPEVNPIAKLAPRGFDVYVAPQGQKVRVGRRDARAGEMESFLVAMVRARRAIQEAARGKVDISCARALPKDLGEWQALIEFLLGPRTFGKDLDDVSAMDFARAAERDSEAFCRQGYGALLARLAEGLPVQLSAPVTRILSTRTDVEVETAKGRIGARSVIVTVSTGVLAAGKIRLGAEPPKRQIDAAARLALGSQDHIALELTGNPLQLLNDDLVFEKANGARTGAFLANVSGSPLCLVSVGGKFGRTLAAEGEKAMTAFAVDWLVSLFGADIRKAVGRSHATQWNADPWTLGAASAASPGNQGSRRILMEPLRERIFFAGEAIHETLFGTVEGAWESGERAADAALKAIGRR
jgi:monoamine oxidase